MRLMLQTLLILFLGFAALIAEEGYFGQPYYSNLKINPYQELSIDSAGVNYFTGNTYAYKFHSIGSEIEMIEKIGILDSLYEIKSIGNLEYGKNSRLMSSTVQFTIPDTSLAGPNSQKSYLVYQSKDTTVVWERKPYGALFGYINSLIEVIYWDGKYWLFGNTKHLITIDEKTIKVDTIDIDGEKIKNFYTRDQCINVYNDGLLYLTLDGKELHYLSHDEYYTLNLDSILSPFTEESVQPNDCQIVGDKMYYLDRRAHIFIFNLKTHDTEFIDLAETSIRPYIEEFLDNEYEIYTSLRVLPNGKLFVRLNDWVTFKPILFKQTDEGDFKLFEVPEIANVWSMMPTPYDYIWLAGPYINPDSDTTYAAVPYFPDGTSVEAVPTMITLRTYPNPTKTQTKVQFYVRPDLVDDLKFTIYDYMGNQIDKLDNEVEYDNGRFNATKTIQSSKYRTGIYYLLIDNGVESKMVGFAVE